MAVQPAQRRQHRFAGRRRRNAARIIDPPPCGYFLTEEQYSGPLDGGTVGLRLGLHGIAQETRPDGHVVRLAQPQRGLIPTLFDAAAVDPEPIVVGTRLFECPYVTAAPRSFSTSRGRGDETVETLTIGNLSPESTSRSTGRSPRLSRTARRRAT